MSPASCCWLEKYPRAGLRVDRGIAVRVGPAGAGVLAAAGPGSGLRAARNPGASRQGRQGPADDVAGGFGPRFAGPPGTGAAPSRTGFGGGPRAGAFARGAGAEVSGGGDGMGLAMDLPVGAAFGRPAD